MDPPIAAAGGHRDTELLRRFAAGEPAACRTVERWARIVLSFRAFGLSREDREDVLQDSLAAVWRLVVRPEFRLTHGLRAVVRTVVSARVIDRLRRRRPQTALDETLADPARGPLEHTAAESEGARVRAALAELGPACRELIRRHFFEELAYREMASLTGRNETTLRVRMHQCLRALKRRLEGSAA
ncbi:MAG TPA: sigma-70 family RNA polymerase sigma factor [Dongiaceae bacterium]|nr:sigma-70 family RNA polymerase sigma factor [Dongiaceae bacterium]